MRHPVLQEELARSLRGVVGDGPDSRFGTCRIPLGPEPELRVVSPEWVLGSMEPRAGPLPRAGRTQGGPGFFALQPLVSWDPHVYCTARRRSWSVLPPAAHHSPAWAPHSQPLYSQACNSVPGDPWAPQGPQLTQRWKQHWREEPGDAPPCVCRLSAPPGTGSERLPFPAECAPEWERTQRCRGWGMGKTCGGIHTPRRTERRDGGAFCVVQGGGEDSLLRRTVEVALL